MNLVLYVNCYMYKKSLIILPFFAIIDLLANRQSFGHPVCSTLPSFIEFIFVPRSEDSKVIASKSLLSMFNLFEKENRTTIFHVDS